MPIEKDEGFRLIKGGEPFTTIVNASLELLKNPVAIAIWVYLCSKPKDWIVRPTDLMNRFEIGRYQYLQAMKELRLTGLVWDLIVKDGLGKILEKRIVCDYVPHEKTHESGYPTDGFIHKSDYPTVGKSDPLVSKDLLQIKEKDTNKILLVIAENWYPTKSTIKDLIFNHNYDQDWIEQQIPSFVAYWLERGEPRASWNALFINHCEARAKS